MGDRNQNPPPIIHIPVEDLSVEDVDIEDVIKKILTG